MAVVLNEEQQKQADLIDQHDLYIKLENKFELLFSTVQQCHKSGFFHKLFNPRCKLCKLMKVIK